MTLFIAIVVSFFVGFIACAIWGRKMANKIGDWLLALKTKITGK